MDQRKKRDGRVIEELGHYNPEGRDPATQVVLNGERIQYWLGVGAQPTNTVRGLLKRVGLTFPASA